MATIATVALPLLKVAAPILFPLIKWGALQVEHLFGAGKGQAKKETLYDMIAAAAAQAAKAGTIPGELDSSTLSTLIENVVGSLNAQGILNPATAAALLGVADAVKPAASASQFTITGTVNLTPKG